jgi:hypothetical protein
MVIPALFYYFFCLCLQFWRVVAHWMLLCCVVGLPSAHVQKHTVRYGTLQAILNLFIVWHVYNVNVALMLHVLF